MTRTAGTSAPQACTRLCPLPPSCIHVLFRRHLPSSCPASGARTGPSHRLWAGCVQAAGEACGRLTSWAQGGCLSCSLQRPRALWPCWAPGPGWEAVALLLWGPTCPCGCGGWRNSFPKGLRLCQATGPSGRASMLCTDRTPSPGLVGVGDGLAVSRGARPHSSTHALLSH